MSQFDITINNVCADCNAGWLNDLEDLALPTLDFLGRLEGERLTTPQLSDFAFWSVTRALLRTHTSSGGRAPHHLFQSMYNNRTHRTIPPGCAVLIAPTRPVDMEAGSHQSAVINGGYLGQVAVAFGALFVTVFLGGPDATTVSLSAEASRQLQGWFPGAFWELAPNLGGHPSAPRPFTPEEAKVAGACLGFLLDSSPCDQFGRPLRVDVVPDANRGELPWPIRRA